MQEETIFLRKTLNYDILFKDKRDKISDRDFKFRILHNLATKSEFDL